MARALILLSFILSLNSTALAAENCLYIKSDGTITSVEGRNNVPSRYRRTAKCTEPSNSDSYLAKPKEIELEGTTRRERISTPLGTVNLRWPRSIERDFGRTPLRAVVDAARAASRALQKPGFPSRVRRMKPDWDVVFLDENLPETQIPRQLISNCHPGWMTPPANIYIVGQRVSAGCGNQRQASTRVADAQLAEVLIHEIGHVIEFQLLSKGKGPRERFRSEGFATWFEQYVADYSSLLNKKHVRGKTLQDASRSLRQSPGYFYFRGSAEDYARASMYFNVLVKKRGVSGIIDVYDKIINPGIPFFGAVDKVFHLNQRRLDSEVARYVEKNLKR